MFFDIPCRIKNNPETQGLKLIQQVER